MKAFRAAPCALVFFATFLPAAEPGRIVILGFDGVDARVVEEMLGKGQLPNLAALQAIAAATRR